MKKIQKIKNIIPISNLFLLLLGVTMVSGCVKRELEYHQTGDNVVITLDWQESVPPSEVCYLFYDESGTLTKEVTGSSEGVKERLPDGKYHFVAYSCDAQQVSYRGLEHHNTAEVFAQQATVGRAANSSPEVLQPQAVYSASSCQGAGELIVEQDAILRREMTPKPLTKQIKFHFTVKNATHIESLSGVLNGIAPSVSLTTGKSNLSSTASTSFTGIASGQDSYIIDIHVFDLLASQQSTPESNTMDITLVADDKQYEFSTDLTEAIKEIADKNEGVIPIEVPVEVEITIEEINGSISATVKPWDDSGTGSGDPRPKQNNNPK